MKTIATSELNFQSQNLVDEDTNGTGEFGFIVELSGTQPCRMAGAGGATVQNPFISSLFDNDLSTKSGYEFTSYLCTDDTPAGNAWTNAYVNDLSLGVGVNEQEYMIICYPVVADKTGKRVFSVDALGEVIQYNNNQAAPFDQGNPPTEQASFADETSAQFVRKGETGADGTTGPWTPGG
jgi:hypothetical protein